MTNILARKIEENGLVYDSSKLFYRGLTSLLEELKVATRLFWSYLHYKKTEAS